MMGTETHPFNQSAHVQRITFCACLNCWQTVLVHMLWYHLQWLWWTEWAELPSLTLMLNQEWCHSSVSQDVACGPPTSESLLNQPLWRQACGSLFINKQAVRWLLGILKFANTVEEAGHRSSTVPSFFMQPILHCPYILPLVLKITSSEILCLLSSRNWRFEFGSLTCWIVGHSLWPFCLFTYSLTPFSKYNWGSAPC